MGNSADILQVYRELGKRPFFIAITWQRHQAFLDFLHHCRDDVAAQPDVEKDSRGGPLWVNFLSTPMRMPSSDFFAAARQRLFAEAPHFTLKSTIPTKRAPQVIGALLRFVLSLYLGGQCLMQTRTLMRFQLHRCCLG